MARPAHILSFDDAKTRGGRNAARSRSRVRDNGRQDIPGVRRATGRHASRDFYDARGVENEYYELEATEADEQAAIRTSSRNDSKRRRRRAKAEREFNRRYESASAGDESGSRPALYKAEMGRVQRKSMRMGEERSGRKPVQRTFGARVSNMLHSQHFARFVVGVCIIAFFAVIVYQPLSDYYGEVRNYQRLEAELAALNEHNQRVESEVQYLQTKEGLEEYARAELGWIKPSEHAVTVDGVESSTDKNSESSTVIDSVPAGSVPAPDTWYSGILDPLLGYHG